MQDLQREILSQVAAGTITAEEGAARLEALQPSSSATEAPAPPQPASGPTSAIRQVKVISRFGNTEIVGDHSITSAIAEGPHRARQEGDTLVIDHSPVSEDTTFEFVRPHGRVAVNGFDFSRKLTVRMNPDLPLTGTVQAGNLKIYGLDAEITAEVQAGNCKVVDFKGPITLSVMAGNIDAAGRIDRGSNVIRCEMGQVRVDLDRRSSVRISAHSTMGKVAIDADGMKKDHGQVTLGAGDGSLDVECTMGNVKVSVD